MTLRELINQVADNDLNSSILDYEIAITIQNRITWTSEYKVSKEKIRNKIYIAVSRETLQMMLESN